MYIIEKIKPSQDKIVSEIIKNVGAEYGALGDGYGTSDPEVICMSQHYKDENKSTYLIATINNQMVGGGGIAAFNESVTTCEL